jgi:hypothetical protein
MASSELTKMSIENSPTPVATQPTASFDKQLADIKSQAAKIVTAAQKVDPNIKISTANAEMIGMPKVNIPTTKAETPRPTALDTVGTTPIPKTSQDVAREAILSQVPEADRDTIASILDISTGYQTEKGRALESTAESLMTQQLSNIQATRDKALESSKMKEAAMLPELEAELESIRGEYDVMQARRNAAIQAEERRQGVSTAAMQGNVSRISRDFDLEQANFAIRELAAVGKINAATKLIDTKLDLKYGDLEAETNLLTAQINAISPFLNREDQKAAETRLQLNEIVKTKIADARDADKALEEFKLQSYLFAQQNGATPATLSQIMSSTSREDVASVGGGLIQDPMQKLQMAQARESILTSQASRANIYDQINARKEALRNAEQEAVTENEKAQVEKIKASEKALEIKKALTDLQTMSGKGAAVGAGFKKALGGMLWGVSSDAVAGSARADFEAAAIRVKNLLTLDNLKLMSGVLSETDIKILETAGSNLANFSQSEDSYNKEIQRVIDTMNRNISNNGITTEQAAFWGVLQPDEVDAFNSLWETL